MFVVTAPADGLSPVPGALVDVLELALGVGVGVCDGEGVVVGEPELGLGLPVELGEVEGDADEIVGTGVFLPVPVEQFVPLRDPGELPGLLPLVPPDAVWA